MPQPATYTMMSALERPSVVSRASLIMLWSAPMGTFGTCHLRTVSVTSTGGQNKPLLLIVVRREVTLNLHEGSS